MIIGLDRSFKPRWVYKILKLSKPGTEFKELEPQFLNIIEYHGLKSKKNVLTIIRRYYLQLDKKNNKYFFSDNYLHHLSLRYSYESLKPLLLFVLLSRCPIASFIQNKINLLFTNQEKIDTSLLLKQTRKIYGDRKVVAYAVGYYLTILSYFEILNKKDHKYTWKNRKLKVPKHILKEIIIIYAKILENKEIDIQRIHEDVVFSIFNLDDIENVLKEYNSVEWVYQKRLASRKIVITNRMKSK